MTKPSYHELITQMGGKQLEFLLLQYAPPGGDVRNIGVFIWDPSAEHLHWRICEEAANYAVHAVDQEYLRLLSHQLGLMLIDLGPKGLLHFLETTLSNALQLSQRRPVIDSSAEAALNRVFRDYIPERE